MFAEEEAGLLAEAADTSARLDELVASRASGRPLEHVLGWAAFAGLRVAVEPGVFVPRRRTEALVEEAVRLARPRPVVLDLCCGSGAIGLAIAARLPGAELFAVDLEPAAVACAEANLAPVGGRVRRGDLFEPLPEGLRGRVELLVANVPYVPSGEIPYLPREAREHEPRLALDGGPDGLDVLRRVAERAAGWLAPAGRLLVELDEPAVEPALLAMGGSGLEASAFPHPELEVVVAVGAAPARA